MNEILIKPETWNILGEGIPSQRPHNKLSCVYMSKIDKLIKTESRSVVA